MKSYKLFDCETYFVKDLRFQWLSGKNKRFDDKRIELLESLGYKYDEFFRWFTKSYTGKCKTGNGYNSLEVFIDSRKKHMGFNDGCRFVLGAELDEDYYKDVLKQIKADIREMKKTGLTK